MLLQYCLRKIPFNIFVTAVRKKRQGTALFSDGKSALRCLHMKKARAV